MPGLPDDFADTLARVIAPDAQDEAAKVIKAAAGLDDTQLRVFLSSFAARIRESGDQVTGGELRKLLEAAQSGGRRF